VEICNQNPMALLVIVLTTAAAETNITKKRLLILDLKGCLPCGKQPFFLKQFFTQKTGAHFWFTIVYKHCILVS
jgi:hypothetical protein